MPRGAPSGAPAPEAAPTVESGAQSLVRRRRWALRQIQPRWQWQTASNRLHLFLQHGFCLTSCIRVCSHHEVLKDLLFGRLQKRIVDLDALEVALGRKC